MRKLQFLSLQKNIFFNQAKIVSLVFLLSALLILPWFLFGYLSLILDILFIIAFLIYISFSYDITIPILGNLLNRWYFEIKFKIDFIRDGAEDRNNFRLKINFYKAILKILGYLVILFKSSIDSFVVLEDELRKIHSRIVYNSHEFSKILASRNLTLEDLESRIKQGGKIDEESAGKIDDLFYKIHSKNQRRVSTISLTSLSIMIISTVIVGLIISFIFPHIFFSKAATFNWVQTDWSGGESELTASHNSNQTGWNKYNSSDNDIATSTELTLKPIAGSASIDFNTEENYIQQDSASGTNFSGGTVVRHPDAGATTWTQRTLPYSESNKSITYGNGTFVVMSGGNSTSKAATSPDGITWTQRTMPSSAYWSSVTYGNGLFVAVANNNSTKAATSPDGITWTARTLPYTTNWYAVAYGNNMYVAVNYQNLNVAASSPDGTTWTQRTLPASAFWTSVAYGNGMFVALTEYSSIAASSPNGTAWTQRAMPSSANWISVTYGNGVFVAVAGGGSDKAATSPDGITWTQRTLPISASWKSVTYGDGIFVATATTNVAATSPDGITWTQKTMPSSASWQSVAYGNGKFAAVTNSGTNVAASSLSQEYSTASSYYVTTAAASQLNVSSYAHISGVSLTQTTPTDTFIKYLISFDNRTTWKYFDGSIWQTTTLSNSNLQSYGMDKAALEAITQSQWEASGGFSPGVTATLDFAADFKTVDAFSSPSLDNIAVNYSYYSSSSLISSAYDTVDDYSILSGIDWTQNSTLPTNTGVKLYLRASSTSELLSTTDWVEMASTTATGLITFGCTNNSGAITCDSAIIPASMKDGAGDRWVQYKVELSTSDGCSTPTLSDVTLVYVVNAAPEIRNVSASQGSNGIVTVSYQMRDPDTDTGTPANRYKATVTLQYCTANCSSAGSETWTDAVAVTGDAGDDLDIATDWSDDKTISWTASTDYAGQYNNSDFKIRVKANDKEGANNLGYDESDVFAIDTKTPTVGEHPILVSATITPASLTLSASDDSSLTMKISLNSDLSGASPVAYAASSEISLQTNPDTVYVQFIDAYGNATAIYSATTPAQPSNIMVQDTSNQETSEYRLFIAWAVAADPFGQYEIYRSTDGLDFSLLDTIDVKATNYYTDTTVVYDTMYYYKVAVQDADGNISSLSSSINAKANGVQDQGEGGGGTVTTAVISNVISSDISTAQATIAWDTDLLSNSQVFYITSTGGDFSSAPMVGVASMANNNSGVGRHSVTLTDLDPATTYYYMVKSTDANDNTASSTNDVDGYTFETLSGPVISDVATSSVSNTSATISWTTDSASDSSVFYSTSPALTNSIEISKSSDSTTEHAVALTGLTMGTNYYFYVKSGVATDDNVGGYYYFQTTTDTVAPIISGVTSVTSTTTVMISWTTDELSSSKVQYGATTDYGEEVSGESLTLDHAKTITGLAENATYHYRVISVDANNNSATSTDNIFATIDEQEPIIADTTPPIISNVTASPVYDTVAIITWETNEPSDSTVQYGLTSELGSVQAVATSTYLHSLPLTGLAANKTYYYKVLSADSSDNASFGSIKTFTTQETLTAETQVQERETAARASVVTLGGGGVLYVQSQGSGDNTPPTISGVEVSNVGLDSVLVEWKTDENSDTIVEYGPTNNYDQLAGKRNSTMNHSVVIRKLDPDSTYHFSVSSADSFGNLAQSADKTFTTTSVLDSLNAEEQKVKDIQQLADNQNKDNILISAAQKAVDIVSQAAREVSIGGLETALSNQYAVIEKLAQAIPAPMLSGEPRVVTTANTATVAWRTNKDANSLVAYSSEDNLKISSDGESFSQVIGDASAQTKNHVVEISELKPDTTYIYQVRSKGIIGPETKSANFTFRTQKEILDITSYTAQSLGTDKAVFKWITNTDSDTALKYIPYRNNILAIDEARVETIKQYSLIHEITINDFEAGTVYQIELSNKDQNGNQASKVIPTFSTTSDDLPPVIYQVQSNSAISPGKTDTIQTIISWMTNEQSTSRVYFVKGIGKDSDLLSASSQLDSNYTKKHVAVVTKFEPGSIYRFQVESTDSTGNTSLSKIYTILTPRKQETVFDVIKNNFVDVFGWTSEVGK